MIERDNFIKIMDTLDDYYNGDIAKAFEILGMSENNIHTHMDAIIDAIDADMDPKHLGRADNLTAFCGSYICEWLFGTGEFQEKCKTAGELYDYIVAAYIALAKENTQNA